MTNSRQSKFTIEASKFAYDADHPTAPLAEAGETLATASPTNTHNMWVTDDAGRAGMVGLGRDLREDR